MGGRVWRTTAKSQKQSREGSGGPTRGTVVTAFNENEAGQLGQAKGVMKREVCEFCWVCTHLYNAVCKGVRKEAS